MLIMMNAARFSMAAQALAIADRAYQSALAYAKERLQWCEVGSNSHAAAPIIKHADVRRMLLSLKSQIEAMRALTHVVAASLDLAKASRRRRAYKIRENPNAKIPWINRLRWKSG
jgi:alkylation response protein AidB-like acyl-CoA dehydrogenase